MKEIDFKDRVPNHPGRITLTPVSGQPNMFDMERADDPLVPGTPMNKALLQSITHSRLTGRYYVAAANRVTISSATSTTNPIPKSGWANEGSTGATSGNYVISASGARSSTFWPTRAFDGDAATSWQDSNDTTGETWMSIDFGSPIIITQIRAYWTSTDGDDFIIRFEGTNGTNWVTLASKSGSMTQATIWDIPNTTAYQKYRLWFRQGTVNPMRLYEWAVTGWSTAVYKNEFKITEGVPSSWDLGQRIMIQTSSAVNTVSVSSNTLNGIIVNTILQPNRKYELVYNGSRFDAKEV